MPEQLTKHPDVTLQVLRSAGAKCGEGAVQEILTQCPADRFCKLPAGELCVYGLPEASSMTQLTAGDWQALAAQLVPKPETGSFGGESLLAGAIGLIVGMVLALIASRRRARRL